MHPVSIIIPNNATHVILYKLKQVYDENLGVFHKACRVGQALIKQVGMSVNKQYIISMKNYTMGQLTVSIRPILHTSSQHMKKSLSQMNNFEKEVT